jgi:replicative DNA helicase
MSLDFESEDIIVGRIASHIKKYGKKATGYIGKVVVSSGDDPVLGKKVLMDVSRSHVAIVCGKRGGGKCLSGDTLITLEDGREIPIKDLEKESKKIISLQDNLKLKTNIKEQFYKREVPNILELTLRSGKKIKLTPEHPLFTIHGWKEAKKLKKGSRIATPRIIPVFGKTKIKDCEVKLLAYLIAEGHLGNGFVLFSNTDEKIIEEFKDAIKEFDKNLKIMPHGQSNLKISKIENNRDKNSLRKYLDSLELYNVKSETKFIPENIFQLPTKQLSLFLNRLFSCDGTIYFDKNKKEWNISYSSSSQKLILQVQSLLLRFGLLSIIRTKKTKKLPNYELKILSSQNLEFIKKIGFFGKKEELQNNVKQKVNNPNIDTIPKEIWDIYIPKNWATIGKEIGYKNPKSLRSSINYSPSREKLLKIATIEKNKELKNLATSDIFWDEIIGVKKN